MAVIDPSGFQFIIRLVKGDESKTWVLWERGNETQDFFRGAVQYQDLPIVESVEVTLNLALAGAITVSIWAPYDVGLALLESELPVVGNYIEVQMGYPRIGLMTPWFRGWTVMPQISISPSDGLSMTLNAQGGHFMATRTHRDGDLRFFPNMSLLDAINRIAANYDNPPGPVEAPETTGADDPLYLNRVGIQVTGSDWYCMSHMARQANCDLVWTVDRYTGTRQRLRLVRRADAMSAEPTLALVSRGQIDMSTRFPLLSFESPAEMVWLPRGAARTVSGDYDPESGDEISAEATSTGQTAGISAVGGGSTVVGDGEDQGMDRIVHSARDEMSSQEAVEFSQTEAQTMGSIQATVEMIGHPTVFPSDIIKIEGIGVFSGNYAIQSVTHSLSSSEWTTKAELLANAMSLSAVAGRIRGDIPQENTQEPPERAEATSGGATTVEPEDPIAAYFRFSDAVQRSRGL